MQIYAVYGTYNAVYASHTPELRFADREAPGEQLAERRGLRGGMGAARLELSEARSDLELSDSRSDPKLDSRAKRSGGFKEGVGRHYNLT